VFNAKKKLKADALNIADNVNAKKKKVKATIVDGIY